MNLQEVGRLLLARWRIVALTTILAIIGAIAFTLLTTPLYKASTRLFVSTTAGASDASDLLQGNRLSQERIRSYTALLQGKTMAQRIIDKLDLDIGVAQLQGRIEAAGKPDTVLIDVAVLDTSPVRARDIANALSEEFVVFVRELETPKPGSLPDARVVVEQRASVPLKPIVPEPSKNIATGLLLGLLAGVGLAIIRDLLDNTLKKRETVESITGVSIIGSIPNDQERRSEVAIPFDTSHAPIAEAFRKLRTNLHFLSVDNPPKVIVVTSSIPSEGKSTTAVNIALSLAEADHNVILVDGDMRRPTIDKYLNLIGNVGFSTVLSGEAELDDVVQRTNFAGLSVLAAGVSPPNPSELLGSMAAKKVLSALQGQYDYVILDSPPLLAVTDGAILAANSDGAIVVVRFGETKRDQLGQAMRTIEGVGAKVFGAVFTMTPSRGRSSYGYYRYDHEGYYRYDQAEANSARNSSLLRKVASWRGRSKSAKPEMT